MLNFNIGNTKFEKKSLKIFTVKNPDWKLLAKEFVAFANAQ